jgi:hypothetical protein
MRRQGRGRQVPTSEKRPRRAASWANGANPGELVRRQDLSHAVGPPEQFIPFRTTSPPLG